MPPCKYPNRNKKSTKKPTEIVFPNNLATKDLSFLGSLCGANGESLWKFSALRHRSINPMIIFDSGPDSECSFSMDIQPIQETEAVNSLTHLPQEATCSYSQTLESIQRTPLPCKSIEEKAPAATMVSSGKKMERTSQQAFDSEDSTDSRFSYIILRKNRTDKKKVIDSEGRKRLGKMSPTRHNKKNKLGKFRKTIKEDTSQSSELLQETPVKWCSIEKTRRALSFSTNSNEEESNKPAQRLESIDSWGSDSNNEGEFADSRFSADLFNTEFETPTEPISKSRKINKAVKETNPVISMEAKHQSRLELGDKHVKNYIPEEFTYTELDLLVEPDEVDDHPTEAVATSRASVVHTKNNRKAGLLDTAENKPLVKINIETNDSDAKQFQEYEKEKYLHGSKLENITELKGGLRRSTRKRRPPVAYWSQKGGKEQMKTDKFTRIANDSHVVYELFDWLKETYAKMSSTQIPESIKGRDKVSIPEQSHHTKPEWRNEMSKPDKLILWLNNLKLCPLIAQNINFIRMLQSNIVKIGRVAHLRIVKENGIEYAYYADKDTNYGYMKFNPQSIKRSTNERQLDMKYILLAGSLQVKCDEHLFTINAGHFITIQKEMRYEILNFNNYPALVLVILQTTSGHK